MDPTLLPGEKDTVPRGPLLLTLPAQTTHFFQRASLLRFISIFSLTSVPVSGRRDLRGR
jgi:hypothetical protein